MDQADVTLRRVVFYHCNIFVLCDEGCFRSWWPFCVCQGSLKTGELLFFLRVPMETCLLNISLSMLILTYPRCLALCISSLWRLTRVMA